MTSTAASCACSCTRRTSGRRTRRSSCARTCTRSAPSATVQAPERMWTHARLGECRNLCMCLRARRVRERAHAMRAVLRYALPNACGRMHGLASAENDACMCARAGELQARQPPRCPQCRAELWADAKANRDFISVLGRLELQCGSCESDVLLSNADALRHASECPNNHLRCPMPSGPGGSEHAEASYVKCLHSPLASSMHLARAAHARRSRL